MNIILCQECQMELHNHDMRLQPILKGICLECWEGLTQAERARCNDLLNYLRMTPEQRRAFDRNLGS
jgi:hypothetical protein